MGYLRMNTIASLVLTALFFAAPLSIVPSASGDGGFIPRDPIDIYEPGQNAVICWNGTHERLFLSVNIRADGDTEGLHVVPFPSLPSVSMGNITIFENVTEVFDLNYYDDTDFTERMDNDNDGAGGVDGMVIEYRNMIGSHDITVIRVTDPSDFMGQVFELLSSLDIPLEMWPEGLNDVIDSYLERGMPYFALDRFPVSKEVGAIDALIYDFETDDLIFPLEISSILTGISRITITVIAPDDLPLDLSNGIGQVEYREERLLNLDRLDDIDVGLRGLMRGQTCLGFFFASTVDLSGLKDDFRIERNTDARWMRASPYMMVQKIGSRMGLFKERMLLYSPDPGEGSNEIECMEPRTGEALWTAVPSKVDNDEILRRFLVVEDTDGDLVDDLFVIDEIGTRIWITRMRSLTGGTEWRTLLPAMVVADPFYMHYHGTVRNGDGKPFMVFSGEDLFGLLIVDPVNGSVVRDSGNLKEPVSGYFPTVLILPRGSGDLIFFLDHGGHPTLWDPWNDPEKMTWTLKSFFRNAMRVKAVGNESILLVRDGYYEVVDPTDRETINSWDMETGSVWMCSLVPDSDGDGCDEGFFLGGTFSETREVFKIRLVDGMLLWDGTTDCIGGYPVVDDFDGDGAMDICIRGEVDHMTGTYPLEVLDGSDGSVMWSVEDAVHVLIGADLDSDCLLEDIYTKNGTLTITEIPNNRTMMGMRIMDPEDLIISGSTCDHDSDGRPDLLLNRRESIDFIDVEKGISMERIKVSGETQRSISNIYSDARGGMVVYRQGYRYYSLSNPYWAEIGADRNDVTNGDNITVFVNVLSDMGPVRGATVEWNSSIESGGFSGTIEAVPGLYSASWTAPPNYLGAIRITAVITYGDKVPMEVWTDIMVWNDLIVGKGLPEGVEFNAWAFNDVIQEGSDLNLLLNVKGIADTEGLDIYLIDPMSPLASIPLVRMSNSLWGLSYPVTLGPGKGYVLIRAMKGNLLIWEEFVHFIVVPKAIAEGEPDPGVSIERCMALPETVGYGDSVNLLILLEGVKGTDQIFIDVNDQGANGLFWPMERMSDDLWRTTYEPTVQSGIVELSVWVYKDESPIQGTTLQICVLKKEDLDLLVVPLTVQYRISPSLPSSATEFDVIIDASYHSVPVAGLKCIPIGIPQNWYIERMDDGDNGSLHLFVHRPSAVNGTMHLLLYDSEGRGNVLRLDFLVDEEEGGPGEEFAGPSDDEGDLKRTEAPVSMVLVVILFILLCSVMMVVLVLTFHAVEKGRARSKKDDGTQK